MSTVDLTTPSAIMSRLADIEHDLATRQNVLEEAAMDWYTVKREKERRRAVAFLSADGTVAERQAKADLETALVGQQEEALYEALRAVVRTLETRATIGMALLKAQKFEGPSGPQPSWTRSAT